VALEPGAVSDGTETGQPAATAIPIAQSVRRTTKRAYRDPRAQAPVLQRPAMRALALDVGAKTIGLATSDPDGVIASARDVLARRGEAEDADAVARRVAVEAIDHVVVGLPLELDGHEGRRARLVRRFVDALVPRLEAIEGRTIGLELWDERFSTAAAERAMIAADASRAERKRRIDAVAAQVILQGWLDAKRPGANAGFEQGEP
jgi:putative Holliday junction resolvase